MSYKVSLSDKAEDDFARLDKSVQKQIFKYLKKLEEREGGCPKSMQVW